MKKLLYLLGLSLYCVSAQAQNTLAGNLTVQQTIKLTGSLTPPTITSSVNDYAPTGFATAAVVRIQSDVPRSITGLAGGVAGRMVWLTNVGTQAVTLATESASSTAANRFSFGASSFDLLPGASISIWYDTTSSRWRAATNLAIGGGGGTTDQVARDAAVTAQATADSKQDALINATTIGKITESAGLPLWDGAAWPGGGSGGTGTVTSVSVVSANGVSGSVATATTTPAITLSLGAITPASVASVGVVIGSNLSGTNTGDETGSTIRTKLGITTLSGSNTGDQTTVSGNAGTATALATARAINGVSFDGTANITVPAAAGTLTGTTLASGVTASSLTSAAGGSFGTAAFTAATAYDSAGAAAAITLAGLGGVPTSRTVNGHALSGNATVTPSDLSLAIGTNTQAWSAKLDTVAALDAATGWLHNDGAGVLAWSTPSKSDLGLGSVENAALSTWTGSANLSTVGTITAGTWHGTALADTYIASASAWNAKVSFPGFGTTGTTAAVGNDSRLSDARTPTAHNQAWSTITATPSTLSGYGITDAQPLDSDLTSIAALSTTSYGRSLLTPADAAAARTLIGVSSGGVSSVAGRTGDVTLAQADVSGLTTSGTPQFAKLGIGMAAPSDSIFAVQHSPSGTGGKSAVIVTGALNAPASTDLHPDAYRDSTTYTSAVAADAYASYDSSPTVTGSLAYNHLVSFQARPIYSGSATIDLAALFTAQATHNGSGTLTTAIGAYIQDPLGSGPITHNFGVYVGALTRGTNNWAFYHAGTAPSYFGGSGQFSRIGIGQAADAFGTIMTSAEGGANLVVVSSYSPSDPNSASSAIFRRSRGTSSSPSPVLLGDRLGGFFAGGQYSSTPGQFVNTGAVAVYATENFSATAGGSRIIFETAANGTVSRVGRLEILGSGAIKFNAYGAGTLVTDSAGNITASSDRRLKNVSGKFARGLDSIMELQPKVFAWKPESGMNPDDINVGFIAQDVAPAIPEAVGTDPSGMLTLSDRPIIAALVNAVKELKAENDDLRARVSAIDGKAAK